MDRAGPHPSKRGTEHSFQNWLSRYMVFMSTIESAYPQVWGLSSHLANVLWGWKLAWDAPAFKNDEAFRKMASHNKLTTWELLDDKLWLFIVALHTKARHETAHARPSFRLDSFWQVC